MAAYFIAVRKSMKDAEALMAYAPIAAASLPAANGRIVAARGKNLTVEGDPINSATVIEFPDYETAVAWYNGPEYQAAIPHRLRGGDYLSFILDGTVPVPQG